MRSILLTNKYNGVPLSIVESEVPDGFRLLFLPEQTGDSLLTMIPEADYVLAGGRLKITREVLDRAENLKMIQRSGVGLDALDLDALKAKGIPLYVNQGINSESVAEHALLLILASLRRLPLIDKNTKNGIWKKQEQGVQTAELRGKTVGIIGMGNIARTLVGLLKPFHTNILYHDIARAQAGFEEENNMQFAGITELLQRSDIVTIHCALTAETANLINKDTLGMMKDGAVLINTARGGITDPYAVAEALKNGRLSFAGLDVHASEPIPDDYPLKGLDNVILTPHIGGVTADSFRAMMHDAFRNIECFEQGRLEEIKSYRYL